MLTSGHLVLLLAAVASLVDLHLSTSVPTAGQTDFKCPITFFGREYKSMQTTVNNGSHWLLCANESSPDCFFIEDHEGRYEVEHNFKEVTKPGSLIHTRLPRLKGASPCRKEVELQDEKKRTRILLVGYNFGVQSVLEVRPTSLYMDNQISITIFIRGTLIYHHSFPRSDWSDGIIVDLSSCRSGRIPVLPGSETYQPETCSNLVCDQSSLLSVINTCGDGKTCKPFKGCKGPTPRRVIWPF